MNKKAAIIAGVAIIGLVGAFALTNKKDQASDTAVKSDESIKIVHDLGETEVKTNPKKVVVFDYPTLDTMDALGVDSAVVGLPKENLPEALKKYEGEEYANLGGLKEPDLEAIKSQEPDLIVIGGRQADFYEELNEIAPTISMSKDNAKYLESSKENIDKIAQIFDVEEKANEEFAKVEKKIEEINKKVTEKGTDALMLMINEDKLSVYGDESRFGLLYQSFGFKNNDENIDDSNHGQSVTFEYLAKQNPEVLFVLDRGTVVTGSDSSNKVLDNDIVKSMNAYKNDNIVYLDSHTWYVNDGGLSSLNTMIENVSAIVNK